MRQRNARGKRSLDSTVATPVGDSTVATPSDVAYGDGVDSVSDEHAVTATVAAITETIASHIAWPCSIYSFTRSKCPLCTTNRVMRDRYPGSMTSTSAVVMKTWL